MTGGKMYKTDFLAEPGMPSVVITRMFDESPDVVYKAVTDASQIPHWWGPSELETTVEQFHPEAGGCWRFVQRDGKGNHYRFHGVFHEATHPSRLVYSEEYEGMPGHVSFIIMMLENADGMTRLEQKCLFESVEDRDSMIRMDMKRGAVESMDRLELLLKECCPEVF